MNTNKKLTLATLDQSAHSRTCGYWYVIQSNFMAHTAFANRDHFINYMTERGLSLTEEMPEHGQHSFQFLNGEYREQMHWSYDEFYALQGLRTRTLSNGDYTMAIITDDADGIKTVHTMNPNCKDRIKYDHAESRALFG